MKWFYKLMGWHIHRWSNWTTNKTFVNETWGTVRVIQQKICLDCNKVIFKTIDS